jgi:hypothetical protein
MSRTRFSLAQLALCLVVAATYGRNIFNYYVSYKLIQHAKATAAKSKQQVDRSKT